MQFQVTVKPTFNLYSLWEPCHISNSLRFIMMAMGKQSYSTTKTERTHTIHTQFTRTPNYTTTDTSNIISDDTDPLKLCFF